MLYFSVSPDEYQVNHGTGKLNAALSTKTIGGLDWTYLELINEEHNSTGFPTLYHGLRAYFKYYREFQVDNLQKFLDAGGLDHATAYAKERGRKYGFSPDLSTWSKYTIIRSAIRAEELSHFQAFVEEFVTEDFIRGLKFRAVDIANFYEKNKDYKRAIDIYQILLKDFPDSEDLLSRTGNAYLSMGNEEAAEKYFQRAKEIADGEN
ncbi:MAG: tetratricopeptide repeat protein [Saprospiraceae bacterium]|nr:tetratricopeptide repeat protein [Saprospiraceae bacterium]